MITINISEDNWKKLNSMKEAGESFDEVIARIVNLKGEHGGATNTKPLSASNHEVKLSKSKNKISIRKDEVKE